MKYSAAMYYSKPTNSLRRKESPHMKIHARANTLQSLQPSHLKQHIQIHLVASVAIHHHQQVETKVEELATELLNNGALLHADNETKGLILLPFWFKFLLKNYAWLL